MSDPNTNGASRTVEASVASALRSAQETVRHCYVDCEASVRQSPSTSLFVAVAVGYVLRSLPIGALLGGLIRVLVSMVRPAVLLFSAAKLYELLQRQARPAPSEDRGGVGVT
ncbi:MAG: hypothetical protein QOE70_2288 [Chthoniobacter sp.]|jgi:hypothetical protein|nr:hypothetical protein [Chthoniobacter sp.]